MEEIILSALIFGFMGWGFSKTLSSKAESKTNVIRIDDKNWILNDKLVSFDTDTPALRMQQKEEDDKHYWNYECQKLSRDRKVVRDNWMSTIKAINKYPSLKGSVTDDKLKAITEEYETYVFKCEKLDQDLFLDKCQFLIKKENPIHCDHIDFVALYDTPDNLGTYHVHNPETARYYKGDMTDLMASEFKAKWY